MNESLYSTFEENIKKNKEMIKNITGYCETIKVENTEYTIFINSEDSYQDSYLYSVFSHYVQCAREELLRSNLHKKYPYLLGLLSVLGRILQKFDINKTITINPMFVSTDIHKQLTESEVEAIVNKVKEIYPDYAIAFRCINAFKHLNLMNNLSKQGFEKLVYRQVYRFHPKWNIKNKRVKKINRDLELLSGSEYEVEIIKKANQEEIERILKLYQKIYINKYSSFNPQYTKEFIEFALNESNILFMVLRKESSIDGFIGYVEDSEIIYPLFLGYDTSIGEVPMYRLLQAAIFRKSIDEGKVIHQGAGAATYKKQRGSLPEWEYLYVHYGHLSVKRKTAWIILRWIVNALGKSMVQKVESANRL